MTLHQGGPWAPAGAHLADTRQAGGIESVPDDADRYEIPLPETGTARRPSERSRQRSSPGQAPRRLRSCNDLRWRAAYSWGQDCDLVQRPTLSRARASSTSIMKRRPGPLACDIAGAETMP